MSRTLRAAWIAVSLALVLLAAPVVATQPEDWVEVKITGTVTKPSGGVCSDGLADVYSYDAGAAAWQNQDTTTWQGSVTGVFTIESWYAAGSAITVRVSCNDSDVLGDWIWFATGAQNRPPSATNSKTVSAATSYEFDPIQVPAGDQITVVGRINRPDGAICTTGRAYLMQYDQSEHRWGYVTNAADGRFVAGEFGITAARLKAGTSFSVKVYCWDGDFEPVWYATGPIAPGAPTQSNSKTVIAGRLEPFELGVFTAAAPAG